MCHVVFQNMSVTLTTWAKIYSHVNTNGGVVDCEWYSVLHILLDLCKAVWETEIQSELLIKIIIIIHFI